MTQNLLCEQKQRLERYVTSRRIEIVDTYEDGGYPGNTLDRPSLQALMREAKQKYFNIVLIVNRDRLFRAVSPSVTPRELQMLPVKIRAINEHTRER
jgi:DNA invertase Pin-like site-specific DNA recombinase